MPKMTDDEAFAYYSDPANHEPGARAVRSGKRPMTGHVPVRFSPEAIAIIKAIAEHDGMTVSTWIRQVVTREVERRQPPTSAANLAEVTWEAPAATVRTVGYRVPEPV